MKHFLYQDKHGQPQVKQIHMDFASRKHDFVFQKSHLLLVQTSFLLIKHAFNKFLEIFYINSKTFILILQVIK